jgi:hypothetical protein
LFEDYDWTGGQGQLEDREDWNGGHDQLEDQEDNRTSRRTTSHAECRERVGDANRQCGYQQFFKGVHDNKPVFSLGVTFSSVRDLDPCTASSASKFI